MTLPEQSRAFVAQARLRKSERCAFLCWAYGIPAQDMATANESQWVLLARAAGVNLPSAETRHLVLKRLAEYEQKGAQAA